MGVEAYYHHGPNVSEVCIGTWPKEALREQEMDGGEAMKAINEKSPILVLGPGAEIPPAMKEEYSKNLIDKETGQRVQVLEQKVEVVDPTLRATMEQYPHHSVNGFEDVTQIRDPRSGVMINDYKPSMIVPIPHSDSLLQHQMDTTTPVLISPVGPSQPPAGGRLRSVGQ